MADEVSKGVGLRPPPPVTGTPTSSPRTILNSVGGTAGSTDPIADRNNAIPVSKTRASFRNVEFQRVIQQHGKRVRWRKAMLCPCINADSDQVALDCTDCDGSGYFYVDPLDIQAVMLAFDSKTRLYEKFGLWTSGEVGVTTHNEHRLGFRDSLEMTDDLMNFNELIKKGNRRGRRSSLDAHTDAARYRISQLTKALVKMDSGIVALQIGYHMTLNASGHIVWTAQGEQLVADGTIVSIHYDFHPVWIVTSHPHVMRSDIDGFKKVPDEIIGLPLNASAQLDYLADTEKHLPTTGSC